jgi:hypothetical protein
VFSPLLRVIVIIVTFKTVFSHMAFPMKQVWSLEELHIIGEVEKTPSEKRFDVPQGLGLLP